MWSLLGQYDRATKNSYFGYVLAVLVAMETFNKSGQRYQLWMCVLILASALFITKKALNAKSFLGIATALLSLFWLMPIFNSDFFYNIDATFMLLHSALSLSVAVGAFTYLKN